MESCSCRKGRNVGHSLNYARETDVQRSLITCPSRKPNNDRYRKCLGSHVRKKANAGKLSVSQNRGTPKKCWFPFSEQNDTGTSLSLSLAPKPPRPSGRFVRASHRSRVKTATGRSASRPCTSPWPRSWRCLWT